MLFRTLFVDTGSVVLTNSWELNPANQRRSEGQKRLAARYLKTLRIDI
jgi:hypothetical protein